MAESKDGVEFELDFSGLDITSSEDIDFDQIDGDLDRFQQDDIVRAALDKGVDLRNYSRSIDKELRMVEAASISDYVREADSIAELFNQVSSCETVLMGMQDLLQGFRSDLGGISQEIKALQNDSLAMNIKLRNRRSVAGKLTLFLDKVAVSEDMILVICDGEIDDTFITQLKALSEKLQYTSGQSRSAPATPTGAGTAGVAFTPPQASGAGVPTGDSDEDGGEMEEPAVLDVAPSETLAGRDALPELDRLRVKAVTRVREFLLLKLAELRQPKTNVQKLQEYVLLKFAYLMEFLSDHSQQLAQEVKQAYVDSMGRMLCNMFKTYHACLAKLELQVANKHDLIAVEQNAVRSMFSSRVDLTKRTDAFCLGDRKAALDDPDAPPIHIHVAQAEKRKYPYEVLFRSLQKHLMDAACAEQSFTSRFFGSDGHKMFLRVFARSLSQVLENLEDFLCQCHDAVGLLLMIHITQQHRRIMAERRVTCLETYFNHVNMLLWPRFKAVFDLNLESVRVANPRKLGRVELHPHYITRRYAEFCASVLTLHRSLQAVEMSDEMVVHNLTVLRGEVMKLLQRLSEAHARRKDRTVFMINNIDQAVSVLKERHVPAADAEYFRELLHRQTTVFVEEELAGHFRPMIQFVIKTEGEVMAMRPGGAGAPTAPGSGLPPGVVPVVDKAVAETLVRDFSRVWQDSIAAINASVLKHFASYANGMEILKQTLTQLLLYYTRFMELIKRGAPELEPSLVRIQDIFATVRNINRSFE